MPLPSRSRPMNRVSGPSRRTRRRPSACLRPGMERLEDRMVLSTIRFINPAGGCWHDPSNREGGRVPGQDDDAVIDIANITVTHSAAGNDRVRSVTNNGATIILSGGELQFFASSVQT